MGTTCGISNKLECQEGFLYDVDQEACVDPNPPTPPPCLDEDWSDSFGDDCSWYLANDPGCALYKDKGQKTHCKAACGICGDVTAPDRSPTRRCATVSDLQSVCGKAQQACHNHGGEPCSMADCEEFTNLAWGRWMIRGLKDGQALGSGYGYTVKSQRDQTTYAETVCVTDNDLHVCPEGFDCDTNVVPVDRTPAPTPAPTAAPTPSPKGLDPPLWPSIHHGSKCEPRAGVEVASADECEAAAAAGNHSYYSYWATSNKSLSHCFTNEECPTPVETGHPWVVHMQPWPEIKEKQKCENATGNEYESQAACQLAAMAATHHYYSWNALKEGKWISLSNLSAEQSSTSNGKTADKALDGEQDTCAHTDAWDSDYGHAWWKVDMLESHDVFSVQITNTLSSTKPAHISIYLDGRRCAYHNTPISGTIEIPCKGSGKELKIEREDGNLAVCEIRLGIVAGYCFTSPRCNNPVETEFNWTVHEDPHKPPNQFDDFFVESGFFGPPGPFGPDGGPVGAPPLPACTENAIVAESEAGLCRQGSVAIKSPYADNVAMKAITYSVEGRDCNETEADCPFYQVEEIGEHVFPVGHTVVKIEAEDLSSQTTACLQDVYVYDREPPVFVTDESSVDASMTIETANETCYVRDMDPFNAYEALGFDPEATDNCDEDVLVVRKLYTPNMTLLFDERHPQNGIRGRGALLMAYEAHDDFSDGLGLPEKSVHTTIRFVHLTVVDNTPPANISGCPDDIHIKVPVGETEAVVHWTPPVASGDNCDGDALLPPAQEMSTPTKVPGMTLPVGTHTATYAFTDASGNTMAEVCSFKIEIEQKQHEVSVTCPADVQFRTIPHAHFATVTWDDPQAILNGKPNMDILTYPQGVASGMPFPFGKTHVKAHVNHSNFSAECVFAVTVTDPQPPLLKGSTYRCATRSEGAEPYGICGGPELRVNSHATYADSFGYDVTGVSQVSKACCRSEAEREHQCMGLAGTTTKYCLPV